MKALELRLAALRAQFLPASFSGTGTYSSAQLDNARAYRLLVHAEIESYLESRALDLARSAFNRWSKSRKQSRVLIHLLANQVGEAKGLPNKMATGADVNTVVQKCRGQYEHAVRDNHGIKTANICNLLFPVGFLESDIDGAWLATVDGFGAARGAAAHGASVTYTINPQDDFNIVKTIVAGLADIDATFSKLKRAMR
ncbi:MAG: hypothetical protein EPN98_11300 [Phenylobacterium sp.]|nr:MAG: hypothetical protein EPN98_11300 [Phenylobacterium sp.]